MRYPRSTGIVVLLLLSCTTRFRQTRDLQLAASISRQEQCTSRSDSDILRLTLRLRYANVGRQKLILYKGNRRFFQVFISRSGPEAGSSGNELRSTHARYFDEKLERMATPTPGSAFTILSPGSSYETTELISVQIARDRDARFNVSIGPGEHLLHVVSSTWYESRKLAEDLRQRWRTRGLLWTEPITSNGVAFVVGKNRPAVDCQ